METQSKKNSKKKSKSQKDVGPEKVRLDQLLVLRGLYESRSKAQAAILAQNVLVEDQPANKAGQMFSTLSSVRLREEPDPWVSRGAKKLLAAVENFGWHLTGAVALDIGSSTGGFTQVLLERGATRVYAVDVGTNQLSWKLRSDPRVVVLEKTHAKDLTVSMIPEVASHLVMDVSFISVRKILLPLKAFLTDEAEGICLIKPQFEASPSEVGSGGIIRDLQVQQRVKSEIDQWLRENGFLVQNWMESPILGMDGNLEFLVSWTLDKKKDQSK